MPSVIVFEVSALVSFFIAVAPAEAFDNLGIIVNSP